MQLHASVVDEFHALVTQVQEKAFLNKYISSKEPSVIAYCYAVQIKQAEYTSNPFKKLSIFNIYKNKLDQLIAIYPQEMNLRYVRLVIQEKSPSFLGYKNNIPTDKLTLQQAIRNKVIADSFAKLIIQNTSL